MIYIILEDKMRKLVDIWYYLLFTGKELKLRDYVDYESSPSQEAAESAAPNLGLQMLALHSCLPEGPNLYLPPLPASPASTLHPALTRKRQMKCQHA